MPRSVSTIGTGQGGADFPNGTVAVFADLPDYSQRLGEVWYVQGPSIFALHTKGYYISEVGNGWVKTSIKVTVSEDAGSVMNWTDWSSFINFSNGINIGDEVKYQGNTYTNLTGTQTTTPPNEDLTNWSSQLVFNPQTAPVYQEGLIYYDNIKKALSYYNEESEVTLTLGQELLFKVENQTTSTIPNGKIIYPDATTIVGLADAFTKSKSRLIAMTTHDILSGSTGYATRLGQVSGLDTSAYYSGQILYLGTNGDYTDTPPNDGGYSIIIGVVDIVGTTDGVITFDPQLTELTVEVTDTNGFPPSQKENTTLSIDEAARTFSIAPIIGDTFHCYILGEKFDLSNTQSISWLDQEGEHWFYFSKEGLQVLYNPSDDVKEQIILTQAFIASIYWNATDKKVEIDILDERHGISMNPQTHLYLHLTRGAQYLSGLGLGNFNIGDGSLDIDAQFSVSAGVFVDEDITHNVAESTLGGTIPVVYNLGTTPNIRAQSQAGFAVLNAPAGRLYYNQNNGGTWQLTEVSDRYYVLYHIFTVNGFTQGLISVMGQQQYATATAARAGASTEISNILTGLPLAEFVPLGTVIFQTRTLFDNSVKATIITTESGENYVDWRVTEIAQGTAASSHNNLTNLQLADQGVTWGHVSTAYPLVLPRLTTVQRDAVIPVNGMSMYNTTTNQFNFYENGAWVVK